MPDVMRCSPWWGSPARMISMRRISMQHPTRIPDGHLRPMSVNRRRLTADPQMGMLRMPARLPPLPADADPPLPAPRPRQSSFPISLRHCGNASSVNLMFFNQPTRPRVGRSAACRPRTPLRLLTPDWSRQASAQRSCRLATRNRLKGSRKPGRTRAGRRQMRCCPITRRKLVNQIS